MSNKEVVQLIASLSNQIKALQKQLQPQQKRKFYSYKDAAHMLCISVEGLKTRIKRGQMVRITNNNRPLIAHTEIMRFLNEQNPDGVGAFFIKLFLNAQKRFPVFHRLCFVQYLCTSQRIYSCREWTFASPR